MCMLRDMGILLELVHLSCIVKTKKLLRYSLVFGIGYGKIARVSIC